MKILSTTYNYYYDDKKLKRSQHLLSDNELHHNYEYAYDDRGLLRQKITTYFYSDQIQRSYMTEYDYDHNSDMISLVKEDLKSKEIAKKCAYKYNDMRQRISSEQHISDYAKSFITYKYDKMGLLCEEKVDYITRVFETKDLPSTKDYYNCEIDGYQSNRTKKHEYDELGNWTKCYVVANFYEFFGTSISAVVDRKIEYYD